MELVNTISINHRINLLPRCVEKISKESKQWYREGIQTRSRVIRAGMLITGWIASQLNVETRSKFLSHLIALSFSSADLLIICISGCKFLEITETHNKINT